MGQTGSLRGSSVFTGNPVGGLNPTCELDHTKRLDLPANVDYVRNDHRITCVAENLTTTQYTRPVFSLALGIKQ